jgi:homoserine dehydrogenase
MVKVALLGLGTVGSGVWRILTDPVGRDPLITNIEIVGVAVKDLTKLRDVAIPAHLMTTDALALVSDPKVELVIEVCGGIEETLPLLKTALDLGKHVVSANKALLARHWRSLAALARLRGVYLLFEAAVGGGIPLIQPVRQCLGANRLTRLMGIINGTTNYILTAMTQNSLSYEQALQDAQALGFAERDPTADVEGYDAQEKLALLSALVFRTAIVPLADIPCEGITNVRVEDLRYAQELGFGIKLLAVAERNPQGELYLRVAPYFVPQGHPLHRIQGANNAVLVEGEPLGQVLFAGPGAGSGATASAVVADILNIAARLTPRGVFLDPMLSEEARCAAVLLSPLDHGGRFYVRLGVMDKPGVIGMVGQAFGDAGVSLASVVQKASHETHTELVVITHSVREGQIQAALEHLRTEGVTVGSVLRVLDEETV